MARELPISPICKWRSRGCVPYRFPNGKACNITFCRCPDNFGYPFARLVIADSCNPYPVSLKEWNEKKVKNWENKPLSKQFVNHDNLMPVGCRFFEPAKPDSGKQGGSEPVLV